MKKIEARGICKAYDGRQVLNNVSFTLTAERPLCLMASSGGGKTTLLRILLGLEKCDSGTVTAEGVEKWAVVFQENRLLDHLDAKGNLKFILGSAYDDGRAEEVLKALGIGSEEEKQVRNYSGGMKRRLALARALLAPADALAMDEPFAGLDEENKIRATAVIRKMATGKPMIIVTHDADDASALGAGVLTLG